MQTRVKRLEAVAGAVAGVTQKEFEDAVELLRRHGRVFASKILHDVAGCDWDDPDIDPNEAALMMAARTSGQIDAARDIERRYWRARGIDIQEQHRLRVERTNESLAAALEIAARFSNTTEAER